MIQLGSGQNPSFFLEGSGCHPLESLESLVSIDDLDRILDVAAIALFNAFEC